MTFQPQQLNQSNSVVPIKVQELFLLDNFTVKKMAVSVKTVTMESYKYICLKDTTNKRLLVIDLNDVTNIINVHVVCEYAIVNPSNRVIALLVKTLEETESSNMGATGTKMIQIYNIDLKPSITKSIQIKETDNIVLLKWISSNVLGYVTQSAVYHWAVNTDSTPVKIFDRHMHLINYRIINYRTDPMIKWCILIGLLGYDNKVIGSMQLYSTDRGCCQIIEGHAACFVKYLIEENTNYSTLFCFVHKGPATTKLHIIEVQTSSSTNKKTYDKKCVDVYVPPDCHNDFPVAMQPNETHGIVYVITMFGYIYLFDVETGTNIYLNKISTDTIFLTAPYECNGGIICISMKGLVLLISIDETGIIPYIVNVLKNIDLALKIATRDSNFTNCDSIFIDKFNQLFQNKLYMDAAKIAVNAPNDILRTEHILQRFSQVDHTMGSSVMTPGVTKPPPILQYFGYLLDSGKKLNIHESLELCKKVLQQNKKQLLEKWLKEDKITCSEELGDIVKQYDHILALSVFLRANKPDKVINSFVETKQYRKIIMYCKKINYKPNYIDILRDIITIERRDDVSNSLVIMNPTGDNSLTTESSLNFAKMLITEYIEDETDDKKMEYLNGIVNLFVSLSMVKDCTAFLLDVLKENKPCECALQTKLLEINLLSGEVQVADAILSNKMFTYYDKNYIGQLCENHGLLERALQHYTDLYDIKRALIQTHQLDQEFLLDYFNNLSAEDALECLKTMLSTNMRQNLKICIKICNRYYKQLTVESVVDLFEDFKCYEGLYYFLGSIIMNNDFINSDDDLVCFKYLQSACKTGQLKEVERICRDVQFNNPEKVKNYLKEIKLSDHLPLIIICDRYNFVNDLVLYLYRNNLHNFLEIYVQKVNPSRLPEVIGILLDVDCNEESVKSLIMNSKSRQFQVDKLVDEIEKRNRLKLLSPWLELRVSEGSVDEAVHNAVAKIYIDTNNNTERFLKENLYYNSIVIGKYCEKRNPHLACIAYERGKCDNEFINVCYENNLFKLAARYIVRRCDPALWNEVLVTNNIPYGIAVDVELVDRNRKQLIDQVIQTASSETHDPEEISETVKAFMAADLPKELIEILEKIVLDNALFCNHKNLQNLLLLTAIKCDRKKLVDYINCLDNYDTKDVAIICINNKLYEEAFIIYKKFSYNSLAIQVLIDNIQNLDRACEFAECCNDTAVWSLLGKAQLRHNFVKGGIDSFIRADDPSSYINVIETAQKSQSWHDLVSYLQMAHKKIRETYIESELIYVYAKTNRLADLEEFISVPNHADLLKIGDRCFDNGMYEAAKILYNNISHYAKLAIVLARLNEFKDAVDIARKANCTKTWKDICFLCLANNESRLAQICGLNIVVHADELQCLIDYYENHGWFDELIVLLETALGLERAHMGIFTELSILYAKYCPDKMKEHAELFWCRLNIPKVLKAADEAHLWSVSTFLYHKYEDYDNAVMKIIDHPTESWRENHFKDIITKVSNCKLYYEAIRFYFMYKPLLLNDLLMVLSNRLDHTKLILLFTELNCLHLIKPYLLSVQTINNKSINEVLNDIMIEEEDYVGLRNSIDLHNNIDHIMLAQKLEKHELIELRRLSAYLYKISNRWSKSIEICKQEKLYKDAMKYAAESKSSTIAEDLLSWFLMNDLKDYFAALQFQCYDLLHPDIVLELSWKYNIVDYAMPYLIQTTNEYINKIDKLQDMVTVCREMLDKVCSNDDKMLINSNEKGSQLMLVDQSSKTSPYIHK